MFNKILVMSPLSNIGTTTVTSILAHTLALNGMSTMLMYTAPTNALTDYFGLPDPDAPPSNISIIASTMTDNQIPKKTLLEYSHHVPSISNLHIINAGSETIDSYSRDLLLKLVIQAPPTQVVLVDVYEGLDDPRTSDLIDNVDCVLMVLNMSQQCVDAYLDWASSGLIPPEKLYPVVNMYNETVIPIQRLAEQLQVLPSRMNKIHYNPYITRCTFMKALYELVPVVYRKDPNVAQLFGDCERLYNTIIDANQEKRFAFNLEDEVVKVKSKLHLG